jgi:hypothetical protein
MATKTYKFHVQLPKELEFSPEEMETLQKRYKTATAQVLKARGGNDPAPVAEGNVGHGRTTRRRSSKKRAASKK